jgi:acyl-CoA thioester hydrolase
MKADMRNKGDYPHIEELPTRWADNDMYGHVNNVVYYAYFDSVVNRLLINRGWLNPLEDKVIAVVAETQCQFFNSVAYPEILEIGLIVERVGNSSVTYRLGVFSQHAIEPAAQGRFVHVYVDNMTRQPVPIPPAVRQGLLALTVTS